MENWNLKYFPEGLMPPDAALIEKELARFGVAPQRQGDWEEKIRLINSSHDEKDIRLNFLVDKRYVLRISNGPDLSGRRLAELNRLIGRYKEFGLVCPAFLPDSEGRFIHSWQGLSVYLAEYVDLPLLWDLMEEKRLGEAESEAVWQEVLDSLAGFAQRYKNVDLSETMGMYSLFDLSPFDREEGIDEKQQNFNSLLKLLREQGQETLAESLLARHAEIRSWLLGVYRQLPRCVFQADENASNLLVSEDGHFAGFIDFNLAGTEVIVNQFANLGGGFEEEKKSPIGAQKRLSAALESYRSFQGRMLEIYQATSLEREAMARYSWIALTAGWPQVCFFKHYIEKDQGEMREEILALLALLANLSIETLIL